MTIILLSVSKENCASDDFRRMYRKAFEPVSNDLAIVIAWEHGGLISSLLFQFIVCHILISLKYYW